MILYELTGQNESDPIYEALEVSNGGRHYSFLESIVSASIEIGRPFLSQTIIKAINYHAIVCLHINAGEYRPCEVEVGDYTPPPHYLVNSLMDDFVNSVNRWWDAAGAVELSSYVLWQLNRIHPFVNGNGRTARAACYFVLCIKEGGWLGGGTILPELLRQNREDYIKALREVDARASDEKFKDNSLQPLNDLILKLLQIQVNIPSTSL